MLKRLFWIAAGAAAALQIDRWWRAQRSRFSPNALTGSLLDAVNKRLEERNRNTAV
ncbi:MAG TPA: hypothetical protein VM784_15640 [Actinomycetota bacterium]|jgi:hypothetical protein|nr:hypothetical protein [Actinomycetota bacterium]